jgi:hypothetical protein
MPQAKRRKPAQSIERGIASGAASFDVAEFFRDWKRVRDEVLPNLQSQPHALSLSRVLYDSEWLWKRVVALQWEILDARAPKRVGRPHEGWEIIDAYLDQFWVGRKRHPSGELDENVLPEDAIRAVATARSEEPASLHRKLQKYTKQLRELIPKDPANAPWRREILASLSEGPFAVPGRWREPTG